jgi:hypothetical protein
VDSYSFTAPGADYLAHEWLAGVIFHLVHRAAGVAGLIALKVVVFAATTLLLCTAARAAGAGMAITLSSLAPGLFAAASRLYVRPHIFTWLFTAAWLHAWMCYRRSGRRPVWLLALLPLQVLWANLHAGGLMGILLLGLFMLSEAVEAVRAGERTLPRLAVPLLATAGALGASLINPFGYRTLLLPARLTSMSTYMERIFEWQPPAHESFRWSTMLAAWVALGCATVAAAAMAARARATKPSARRSSAAVALSAAALLATFVILRFLLPEGWSAGAAGALLLALPALLALHGILAFRRMDVPVHLLGGAFLALATRHNRSVAEASLVLPVLLAASLSRWLPPGREGRSILLPAGSAALLVAAGAVALLGYPYDFAGDRRPSGTGIGGNTPLCAVDFIEGSGLSGNAFVSYAYAGLLVHRMSPSVLVNIDSRNDVYGEEPYADYLSALGSAGAMRDYLRRWPVDFFLLGYRDAAPGVGRDLLGSGEWAPVFFDSSSYVLVRRSTAPPGLAEREEYRILRPSPLGATRISAANAPGALAEADRSIARCPGSFFGLFYRAKALAALGRFDEAVEAGRAAIEESPGNAIAWADMGFAQAALGDIAGATESYKRALELDPSSRVARENLRRLRR